LANHKDIYFKIKQTDLVEIHDFVFKTLRTFDIYHNLYNDLNIAIKDL